MITKKFIITLIIFGSILSLAFSQAQTNPQDENRIIIPDEVKSVLQQGLVQRQGRQDIPFTIFKHLYLPTRQNMHSIFLFKAKNSDFDYVPQAFALVQGQPEEVKEKTPPEEEEETPPAQLQCSMNAFLQFYRLNNNEPLEIYKEVYIPINFLENSSSYVPEKEQVYSTGYPLPAGNYLLAMAITSLDLQKVGTYYSEFSLPDMAAFTDRLDTTPIFFVKEIKRMAAPETTAEIHKGFFTYSVLQITPVLDNIFSQKENLDVLFYILGTRPKEDATFDINIDYEVLKGEEKVIRYAKAQYKAPIISQQLPLVRTVIVKNDKGEEKKEEKNIEPGSYSLSIKIKDNVSGNSVDKVINFEVK